MSTNNDRLRHALSKPPREVRETVEVSGIFLRRLGDYVIVEAEVEGRWVEVIREHHDGAFSHIVEPSGIRARLLQSLLQADG